MGLDFMVYKRNKQTGEVSELAYGRKSWELVHALNAMPQDPEEYEVPLDKECWIDLMEKISAIAPYLEDIFLAYRKYEYCSDDEEELVLTRRDKQLMRTYAYWHDSNFDEYPQLGYDWSVGYMLSFWEAADAVLDALEDDNYEVYTVASY